MAGALEAAFVSTKPRTSFGKTLVVAVTALVVLLLLWRFSFTIELVAYAFLAVVGVQLSVIDLRRRILPNVIVVPSIGVGAALLILAAAVENRFGDLITAVLGAVVLFALYLGLALLSPKGLGMGDVKLAALIGLYLGFQGWPQLLAGTLAAFVLAALAAAVTLAVKRGGLTTVIPFGPFMLAGAALALLPGDPVTHWMLPLA
ncbi:MAG: prepilin peptidase [Cryobacterium sp.]|jgi:leader peptidase (prepilin peptidase)/N-methyltransferase|nr:prepilin peptidase [Cryobacterium sp.]